MIKALRVVRQQDVTAVMETADVDRFLLVEVLAMRGKLVRMCRFSGLSVRRSSLGTKSRSFQGASVTAIVVICCNNNTDISPTRTGGRGLVLRNGKSDYPGI